MQDLDIITDEFGRQITSDGRLVYEPGGPTISAFLQDRSPAAIIRGPVGSGTSVACCQRIWQHLNEQNIGPSGKKRSRWIIVRDTYNQIRTTTLKTWQTWFPEDLYGPVLTGKEPYLQRMNIDDIEAEIYFYAMSDGSDENMLSLEPTGLWFNELEGIGLELFATGAGRTGRYPPMIEGGSKWSGVIGDMNAVPDDHWVPRMFGEAPLPDDMPLEEKFRYQRPEDWAYFVQPPAMFKIYNSRGEHTGYEVNPEAENLKFLEKGYYEKYIKGRPVRKIDLAVCNKIVPRVDGDPVWPDFNRKVHVVNGELEVDKNEPLYIGIDFGRNPAVVMGQKIDQRWRVMREIVARDVGTSTFAPRVIRFLNEHFPDMEYRVFGDPKGRDKGQNDETTGFRIYRSLGLNIRAAPVKQNNIRVRVEAVEGILNDAPGGVPRFTVSSKCARLVQALDGSYRYPKARPDSDEREKPLKDFYSNPADALQYMVLGGGEGRISTHGNDNNGEGAPVNVRRKKSRRRA